MAKACLRDSTPFGVCLIREGAEVGAPATPAAVGTTAGIISWDMPQLGLLQIVALGGQRFRILERRLQADGLARARIAPLATDSEMPPPESCSRSVRLLERLAEQQPALFERPHRFGSCSWVAGRLGEVLPLPLETKQELLELDDAGLRLERLNALLAGVQEAS
jgi:hypothetical protein